MENSPALASLVAEPLRFAGAADPAVRRLAIAAIRPGDAASAGFTVLRAALRSDPEAAVRAAAAEALSAAGAAALEPLLEATADEEAVVAEAAATGLGTVGDRRAVPRLLELAGLAADRLVREAAVASLGAIGDDAALPTLLELAATGPPQVRRRCVAALTVFDGPEVEAALLAARQDRNPMVREAAEMAVGRELSGPACGPSLELP